SGRGQGAADANGEKTSDGRGQSGNTRGSRNGERGNDRNARGERNAERGADRNTNDRNADRNNDRNADRNNDTDDERGSRRRRGRDRGRDRKRGRGRQGPDVASLEQVDLREDDVLLPVAGILDILDNYAFVRTSGYLPGSNDVYVSLNQVKKAGLRRGD